MAGGVYEHLVFILNPFQDCVCVVRFTKRLVSKTIDSPALPFQRVNDVQGSDSLASGIFGVCHSVTHTHNPGRDLK